jgi:hypothetical protein
MTPWIEQLRLKDRSKEVLGFLKAFAKQPVVTTRKLPPWDIETTLLMVLYCSLASAVITGLFMRGILALFSSVILIPIMTLFSLAIGTVFFHYVFIFLYDRSVEWKKIFQLLAVATIPFMALRILGFWLGPIAMIGFAVTCLLLIVGFVDNFFLPKRGIMKLMGLIFALFFCQWVYSTIKNTSKMADYRDRISTDSMKVLDSEFKSTSED